VQLYIVVFVFVFVFVFAFVLCLVGSVCVFAFDGIFDCSAQFIEINRWWF